MMTPKSATSISSLQLRPRAWTKLLVRSLCGVFLTLHAAMPAKADGDLRAEVQRMDLRLQLVDHDSTVISRRTHASITTTFSEALTTLQRVLQSDLPADRKAELAGLMTSKMGESFFLILRHQSIDVRQVDGRASWKEIGKQTVMELIHDAALPFRVLRDRPFVNPANSGIPADVLPTSPQASSRVWGPTEERARERLTQELIQKFQDFSQNTLQNFDRGERTVKAVYGDLEYMVKRSIDIRAERDRAQRYVRNAYVGLAIFTLLHAPIDLAVERSFYSTLASSVIFFSALMSVAAMKTMTMSTRALELLRKLAETLRSSTTAPETTLQALRAEANVAVPTAPQPARSSTTGGGGGRCEALFVRGQTG
ncbi:MAG TPA: hypothetical protein PLZ57_11215 [Pseudobdellovibrionaceae bacterium]|nr:hypothetical protein [Pseudobdellovibrionaceae bacterium]